VETLEARWLLSSYVWNNLSSASANWSTAANWTPGTSYPQTSADSANLNVDVTVNQAVSLGANVTVNSLTLGDSADSGGSAHTQTISSGNTLTFANGSGAAALTLASNAVAGATVASSISLSSNLLITNNSNQTLTISGAIAANGHTITVAGSGNVVISGIISNGTGSGAVVQTASGTLTLSGSNTYTGGTTVSAGTLSISSDANLGAVPSSTVANSITLNGGTLQLTAGTSAATASTINANRGIYLGSSGGTINLTFGYTGGSSNHLGTETALVYGGVISGTGSLTVTGIGGAGAATQSIVDLKTAATYGGNTTINNAVVQVNSGSTGIAQLVNFLPTTTVLNLVNHGLFNLDADSSNLTIAGLTGDSTGSIGTSNQTSAVALTINASGSYSFPGVIGPATVAGKLGIGTELSLIKSGNGTQTLGGSNAYGGGTTISAGTLSISSDANLGAVPSSTVANSITLNGGTLQLTAGTSAASASTINANRGIYLGSSGGTINLTFGYNGGTSNHLGTETALVYGGVISGPGSLTITGIGGAGAATQSIVDLKTAATYGGNTTINNAVVQVNSGSTGIAQLVNVLPTTTVLNLVNHGLFNLDADSSNLTIAGLTGDSTGSIGTSNQTSAVALTFNGAGSYSFPGVIGPATVAGKLGTAAELSLIKKGSGTLILGGSNTYTGTTTLSAGMLRVDGALAAASAVSVAAGATLDGIGTIAGSVSVASAGILAPGDGAPGTLTTGNLTLASGADFDSIINGTSVGSFGQVDVTGNVSLSGATLNLTGNRTNHAGDVLPLISNAGSHAITGTFASLAQGATVTVNGVNYLVSYTGGSGNSMTLTNAGLTVATAAAASPSPVTGTTAALSVLGADPLGESHITYTWATTGTPPATVTFSANGTNAAKNTTATFTKAGTYNFQVTLTDTAGLSTTSSVNVTVNQTLTSITLSPSSTSINEDQTTQFAATAKDQFGNALTTQPSFTWSVPTGIGSVSSSGLYTAPASTGSATVKAASPGAPGVSQTASVSVGDSAPTVATPTAASPSTVTGTTTALSVLGAYAGGESNLTYTWATTGTPPASVSFSANGTNAAKNSTATFTKAGSYNFQVTISDGSLSTTASVNVTVNQTLTSITLSPSSTSINEDQTTQFTATAKDQFGNALTTQPSFTWSVPTGIGSVSSAGLYTAPASTGSATVKAASGSVSGTASVSVSDAAPTVATPAAASPLTVTGTTTALSVLGAYAGGESNLTYTWATTGTPPAAVTFSVNGTNAAKNSTATFTKAGSYSFQVTISDGSLSTTSSVSVTVNQTLTSITVSPSTTSINEDQTAQFAATAKDQFGNALTTQPSFTWSVPTGIGSVSSAGLYTAPASTGSATVKAVSGSVSQTASVSVTDSAPTVATPAAASPHPVTGTTTALSVLGAYAGGESHLTYTWATTGTPPAAVTFSANGTNAAKNTTATFTKAGSYSFQVTISDGSLSTTASVNVTVNQTVTSLSVNIGATSITSGSTQQFTATGTDQFGNAISSPAVTWSIAPGGAGGTISSTGLYTAPSTETDESDSVVATDGSISSESTPIPINTTSDVPATPTDVVATSAPGGVDLGIYDLPGIDAMVFNGVVLRSINGAPYTAVWNLQGGAGETIAPGIDENIAVSPNGGEGLDQCTIEDTGVTAGQTVSYEVEIDTEDTAGNMVLSAPSAPTTPVVAGQGKWVDTGDSATTTLGVWNGGMEPVTNFASGQDFSPGFYRVVFVSGSAAAPDSTISVTDGDFGAHIGPTVAEDNDWFSATNNQINGSEDIYINSPRSLGVVFEEEYDYTAGPEGAPTYELEKLDTISYTGNADVAYQGDNKQFTVGGFTVNNTSSSAGDYTALIDWGDGNQSTGTVVETGSDSDDGGDDTSYDIEGSHEYDRPGPYVVTAEIYNNSTGNVDGVEAGYIDVLADAPTQSLQADYDDSISVSDATATESVYLDNDSGTYTISDQGSLQYAFSQSLDAANEGAAGSVNTDESNVDANYSLDTTGSFDASDSPNLDVGTYSVASSSSATLAGSDDDLDLDNQHATTFGPDGELGESGSNETFSDTRTYAGSTGDYSWHHQENNSGSLSESGTLHSDPLNLRQGDALSMEDAPEWAWEIAHAGLVGTYTATGSDSASETIDETGNYNSDTWNSTETTQQSPILAETGGNGQLTFSQTVAGLDSDSITSNGTGNNYSLTDVATADDAISNRTIHDQSSTTTDSGDVDVTLTVNKSGDWSTGEYDQNTTGKAISSFDPDTSDQSQSSYANDDQTLNYSDSNSGNVDDGDFAIDGSLSGIGSSTEDLSVNSLTAGSSSNNTLHETVDESGDLFAGDEDYDASGSATTTVTGSNTDQTNLVNTTGTTTSFFTDTGSVDESTGDYDVTDSGSNNNAGSSTTTNQSTTSTDTNNGTGTSTVSGSGNVFTGAYSIDDETDTGTATVVATSTNQAVTSSATDTTNSTDTVTGDGNDITGADDSDTIYDDTVTAASTTTNKSQHLTDFNTATNSGDNSLAGNDFGSSTVDDDYDSGDTDTWNSTDNSITASGGSTSSSSGDVTGTSDDAMGEYYTSTTYSDSGSSHSLSTELSTTVTTSGSSNDAGVTTSNEDDDQGTFSNYSSYTGASTNSTTTTDQSQSTTDANTDNYSRVDNTNGDEYGQYTTAATYGDNSTDSWTSHDQSMTASGSSTDANSGTVSGTGDDADGIYATTENYTDSANGGSTTKNQSQTVVATSSSGDHGVLISNSNDDSGAYGSTNYYTASSVGTSTTTDQSTSTTDSNSAAYTTSNVTTGNSGDDAYTFHNTYNDSGSDSWTSTDQSQSSDGHSTDTGSGTVTGGGDAGLGDYSSTNVYTDSNSSFNESSNQSEYSSATNNSTDGGTITSLGYDNDGYYETTNSYSDSSTGSSLSTDDSQTLTDNNHVSASGVDTTTGDASNETYDLSDTYSDSSRDSWTSDNESLTASGSTTGTNSGTTTGDGDDAYGIYDTTTTYADSSTANSTSTDQSQYTSATNTSGDTGTITSTDDQWDGYDDSLNNYTSTYGGTTTSTNASLNETDTTSGQDIGSVSVFDDDDSGLDTTTQSDTNTGTDTEIGEAGTRSFDTTDNYSGTTASTDIGDEWANTDSLTSTTTSGDTLTEADSYSGGGSDDQTVISAATSTLQSTSNNATGAYTQTTTGTSNNTTTETGEQTNNYTLTGGSDSTYTDTETGNSVTGGYTLTASSNDSDNYTRTGSDSDDDSFSIYQSDSASGTAITTGNHIQGGYTVNSTGNTTSTLEEDITGATDNSTLSQTTTGTSSLTETGNEITGNFTSTDDQSNSTTLTQSGTNDQGTYSLNESSSDSPTVTSTGNTVDGSSTITTNGDQSYHFTQTNADDGNNYTLTGTGSNPYQLTVIYSSNTGQQSSTETGTDTYTLAEAGTLSGSSYSQSIGGTDTYTMAGTLNTQTGGFSLTTTGSGTSTAGDTSFTSTESGDTRDGSVTLSNTGTNRYDLLSQFNNTADGASGDIGMADFSPVGAPVYVGRSSTPSGLFSSVGDDQYEYCFVGGTLVLTPDGSHKAIEKIEPGTIVMAVSENDPEAAPTDCIVREVYHNAPAEILSISIPSAVDPLNDDVIRTTAGHPFYVREKGWIKAQNLVRGDQLRTSDGGWTKVRGVSYSGVVEPVFNLRVDSAHTYFVSPSAGSASVLVHNASAGMGLHNFPKGIDPTTLGQCLAISGKVFGTGLAAIPVAMALPEVLGGTAIDTGLAAAGRLAVAGTRVVQAAAPYVSAYVAAKLATDQKAQDAFLSASPDPGDALAAIFADSTPAALERSLVNSAPTGDTYSVAFQTELKATSYPGVLRAAHFQEANENLLQMMESDPTFAKTIQDAGINIQRTPNGLAPRTSPAGWTWHHAEEPGLMQLVPRWQHAPGSIFQDALHPNSQGGYSIWGQ
jgi:autotransporter-associated beta strand protein